MTQTATKMKIGKIRPFKLLIIPLPPKTMQ